MEWKWKSVRRMADTQTLPLPDDNIAGWRHINLSRARVWRHHAFLALCFEVPNPVIANPHKSGKSVKPDKSNKPFLPNKPSN